MADAGWLTPSPPLLPPSLPLSPGQSTAPGWLSTCPYHDAQFFGLVKESSKETGASEYQLLLGFGRHFIEEVSKDQGWHRMLSCLGTSLLDVMQGGLNDLHLHISMQNPAIMPPDVRIGKVRQPANSYSGIWYIIIIIS